MAALVLLAALGIGGIAGFVPVLVQILVILLAGAGLSLVGYLGFRFWRKLQRTFEEESATLPAARKPMRDLAEEISQQNGRVFPPAQGFTPWTNSSIESARGEIDWYQFEKFCAALLSAEGFDVERKGGAQPDGGVDLVVSQNGLSALIQCKHWKTWNLQEKVIREMLGSMTHFGVSQGAVFTLKGATKPAYTFAAQHDIDIVDGAELAGRAFGKLTNEVLSRVLDSSQHHCPKCEALMVWRTGNFKSFWGCSRYPRCRSVLKYSGAK